MNDETKDQLAHDAIAAATSAATLAQSTREAVIRHEYTATTTSLSSELTAGQKNCQDAISIAHAARVKAEEEKEAKMVAAVMATSLFEHNERLRYDEMDMKEACKWETQRKEAAVSRKASQKAIHSAKTDAVQAVLDAKAKAHALKTQAQVAMKKYEVMESERITKSMDAEVAAQEKQLGDLREKQRLAKLRREVAEEKAAVAMARAAALREAANAANASIQRPDKGLDETSSTSSDSTRCA